MITRRIFPKWQLGYHMIPHISFQYEQQDKHYVSVATIEYSHIFYIR